MALSASTIMQLQESMIDSGANFLIGAVTSPFDPEFSKNQAGLMSVVGSTMGTGLAVANIAGNAVNTAALSSTIVAEAINNISQRLTSYVAECTAKLISMPTAYIAEVTKNKLSEAKDKELKPENIMKRVTINLEDRRAELEKEAEKSKQDNIKNESTSKIQDISYIAANALNKATKELNSIATYVSKGPDWMNKQIEKYSDLVMNQTAGSIGKTVDNFEKTKKSFAYAIGETAANVVLNDTMQKMLSSAKEKLDKIEKKKKELVNKTKAATAQAIMKLKGLLGG